MQYSEIDKLAQGLRAELGIHPEDPIADPLTVIESAGIGVFMKPFPDTMFDGAYACRGNRCVILLNSAQYQPRIHFTAAHELGHHVLGHGSRLDLDIYSSPQQPEKDANAFAAQFLMPAASLKASTPIKGADGTKVLRLAIKFGVSYEAMANRLNNVGVISKLQRQELLADRWQALTQDVRDRRPGQERRLPVEYTERALRAYCEYRISLDRLAEILEETREEVGGQLTKSGLLNPEDA